MKNAVVKKNKRETTTKSNVISNRRAVPKSQSIISSKLWYKYKIEIKEERKWNTERWRNGNV